MTLTSSISSQDIIVSRKSRTFKSWSLGVLATSLTQLSVQTASKAFSSVKYGKMPARADVAYVGYLLKDQKGISFQLTA